MRIRRVMYTGTKFEIIEHGGESYFASVRLRDAILVNPAGVVTVAKQRFGTKQVTLLGTRGAQKRLAQLAEERGLKIAGERQR